MDLMSSLYPTNQFGSDGFSWWIGQIESDKKGDFKESGRFRVRIIGYHPQSCDAVDTRDLPWAIAMMPVTNPHTPGGVTSVSDQLSPGVWVVGFFLDPEKQQPVIMGSIGRVANSTEEKTSDDPTPGEDGCKSFTTFIGPDNKIAWDQDFDKAEEALTATDAGHTTGHGGDKTDEDGNKSKGGYPHGLTVKFKKNTKSNPAGINWCINIADTCGKETDMKGTFHRLFSEMLAEVQNNERFGDYIVGELSGELYSIIDIGRGYVNKGILVVRTFVASVKGFILEKLRAGIKDLINLIIYPNETGNSLSSVTKFFNDKLNQVGCHMADIGDRIADFLEDLIFGYLFGIYKSTMCQVDKFVEGLLNKITSLMEELLETVLGPLSDILGAVASVINIIGDTIGYVLDLLGIECNGPGKSCSKTTNVCTDCKTEERKDFLDELLDNITDDLFPVTGEDWSTYTCADALEGTTIKPTEVIFIGGIQDSEDPNNNVIRYNFSDVEVYEGEIAQFNVSREGKTNVSSSVSYSTRSGTAKAVSDYEETSGFLGFAPGETIKTISVRTFSDSVEEGSENFFMRIFPDTPGTVRSLASRSVVKCTIKENPMTTPNMPIPTFGEHPSPSPTPSKNPIDISIDLISSTTPTDSDVEEVIDADVDADAEPTYSVVADKTTVKEGEFVRFAINTTNVTSGTMLFYRLFGVGVTPSDIVAKTLSGSFTIENGKATVIVGISEDMNVEHDEVLIFGIQGTSAQDSVLILSDIDSFSLEELSDFEDSSSNIEPSSDPRAPVVSNPITGPGGEIIHLPIDDPGDPYKEPPFVVIPGEGWQASGYPLLDSTGRVTEIRITDPGFGYKLNIPSTSNKECIIDSFTMLNPGREYTSEPTVYINGDPTVADAVINSDGRVISVRIKNRSIVFEKYPKVLIIGGGGYGAKFIPSFNCMDREARVTVGSAKIGTGSYIDCP